MTDRNATLDHLERVLSGYPDRASGAELHCFIRGCSLALAEKDRPAYADALRTWSAPPRL